MGSNPASKGHTMTASGPIDPFAGGSSTPSLSFKGAPVGTTYEGTVVESPDLVHSRNFDTNLPDYWPAKVGETPSPKMAAVVKIVMADGEERAIWAIQPSAMFAAIKAAANHAGVKIDIGGTLAVKYTGDKPANDPRKNAAKQYVARYTPPAAAATADPFAATPEPVVAKPIPSAAQGWDAAPPF